MYTLVFVSSLFFFIFCKDDSEMLRLSKKIIELFHDVYREMSQLQLPPPPPPKKEHMTFLVEKIDM
jgi:hypothetical protein